MKKIIIILLLLLVIGSGVYADVVQNNSSSTYIYLFHLYYDNGQLFADRDAKFKYDMIAETFVPETLTTQFPFRGEVINLKGEVASTFQFDPRQGNPKFLKGKISVKAPYFPDGQKVSFYDGQGSQLLSMFVSESSFCNDDGVCNSEVGEDSKTCPNDCKTATPTPISGPTVGGGGGLIWSLIYIVIGVGLAGGLWWYWKKRKSGPPPVETISSLPTPTEKF